MIYSFSFSLSCSLCDFFDSTFLGTEKEIEQFVKDKYGVTFTVFEKVDVNGDHAHPGKQREKDREKKRERETERERASKKVEQLSKRTLQCLSIQLWYGRGCRISCDSGNSALS